MLVVAMILPCLHNVYLSQSLHNLPDTLCSNHMHGIMAPCSEIVLVWSVQGLECLYFTEPQTAWQLSWTEWTFVLTHKLPDSYCTLYKLGSPEQAVPLCLACTTDRCPEQDALLCWATTYLTLKRLYPGTLYYLIITLNRLHPCTELPTTWQSPWTGCTLCVEPQTTWQ